MSSEEHTCDLCGKKIDYYRSIYYLFELRDMGQRANHILHTYCLKCGGKVSRILHLKYPL